MSATGTTTPSVSVSRDVSTVLRQALEKLLANSSKGKHQELRDAATAQLEKLAGDNYAGGAEEIFTPFRLACESGVAKLVTVLEI